MKKFFTSLITLAVLLCAALFANAANALSKPVNSDNAMKILILGDSGSNALSTALSVAARNSSLDIQIISSENADFKIGSLSGFETADVPPRLIAKKIAVVPESLPDLNQFKPKTEMPSINSNYRRTFYERPPDIFGYNGIGFANRTRARPLNA